MSPKLFSGHTLSLSPKKGKVIRVCRVLDCYSVLSVWSVSKTDRDHNNNPNHHGHRIAKNGSCDLSGS